MKEYQRLFIFFNLLKVKLYYGKKPMHEKKGNVAFVYFKERLLFSTSTSQDFTLNQINPNIRTTEKRALTRFSNKNIILRN